MGKEDLFTIWVPASILARAKHYAQQQDTTLAQLVIAYLEQLATLAQLGNAPAVRSLTGSLPATVKAEDYRTYLQDKYQ